MIIALRDPRDVIVSCFFQNLRLNATNANFLSLERTAKHYADLMDVWLRLRELGGFDWLESRYEDIVNNLESEGRRVTEFLGLSWHERQASSTKQRTRNLSSRQPTMMSPNPSMGGPWAAGSIIQKRWQPSSRDWLPIAVLSDIPDRRTLVPMDTQPRMRTAPTIPILS